MRYRTFTALALTTLGIAASGVSLAQAPSSPGAADSWRMPYQRGFWGHAGISVGRGEIDAPCPPGFGCDQKDTVYRAYAGGRFNNAVGLEIGAINLGEYDRGGGQTDGWGLDLALVAGVPIGANSAIFGKLGTLYARTEVTGTATPTFQTGKERGWGARYGIGGQIGLTPQWAVRVDWDRFRIALPGSKEDLDTYMLGVQYTFR
jgi:OOP family OmpA-OmpF porin